VKRRRILTVLALSSFIFNALPVSATPKSEKEIISEKSDFLTLFEAIEITIQNNHTLKLAEERIKIARYQITENAAQGLPQLSINTSYGRQDPVDPPPPPPGLGNNPQFAAFLGTSSVNTFNNQVGLSQVLFAGFRVIDGIRLASVNLEASEESYRQTRQEVVDRVANAYYNALKLAKLVEINRDTLKQAERHLEQAKKLEKAGVGIKLDVVRAENQLVNNQLQLSQAMNNLEKAKKALNLIMGRKINEPVDLNPAALVPENKTETESKIIQTALENRSEIRQLKMKKEIDEIATTIQSRATWPTISANLSYSVRDTKVIDSNSVNNQNLNYGINMNWPVFDGLLTYAKVQKSQNNVIQDQINIDQMTQNIIMEVNQSMLDIQEARERTILAQKSIELAKEALRIAELRYLNGIGISLDVMDQQTGLAQARANLVNAEFDLNISRLKLYKAMGTDI